MIQSCRKCIIINCVVCIITFVRNLNETYKNKKAELQISKLNAFALKVFYLPSKYLVQLCTGLLFLTIHTSI